MAFGEAEIETIEECPKEQAESKGGEVRSLQSK